MDKTQPKLAAFFDNEEEETSFLQKPVDDTKLSQYVSGKNRKSRKEKEQEAADLKKKEEEANAAQVYAEFLDAFEGTDAGRKAATASRFVRAESKTAYIPTMPAADRRPPSAPRSPSPSAVVPKPKGKRAMDSFLEEIKREQAEREAKYSRHGRSATAMAAYEGQSGSKDRGDPQTTNLFVANLPMHVTEQTMGKFFAKLGPVGSVKIMWPRSDGSLVPGADPTGPRRTKGQGLNGFVSYMSRHDAEKALREYDGYDWGGSVLRVGWSKAVPIAAKPLYGSGKAGRSRSRSRSRDRYRSRRSRSPSWDRDRARSPRRRRSYSRSRAYRSSHSRSPRRHHSRSPGRHQHSDSADGVTDTFILAVANEIKGQDAKYEKALRKFEKNNSKYDFLLKRDHRRHAYYRGIVQSEMPPKLAFDDDGYNSVYSSDSAEEDEREQTRKSSLGTAARDRFQAMLRALSGRRGEIARCMAFCLEHAEAAHEVADIIVSSLLVDSTAVPRKVARLHLICDILHNSAATVPSAWKYRQEFQGRIGIVFDHLANIYHSFPGRITADIFKKQITTIVDIWEDWIVFPPDFTTELRLRLEGNFAPSEAVPQVGSAERPAEKAFASRFKSSSFQLATQPTATGVGESSEGEPMDVSSDDDAMADDVDGQPADNDIDGEPTDDIDGEPMDDIDGESVTGIDDVDGEPMREDDGDDLDGEPIIP